MKLTPAQQYIKESLGTNNNFQNMQDFNEKFPYEFFQVRETIEQGCMDVSKTFDAMMSEGLFSYCIEITTLSIFIFNDFIRQELDLIKDMEDVEKLEQDESDLNRELHDRKEAISINKELKS